MRMNLHASAGCKLLRISPGGTAQAVAIPTRDSAGVADAQRQRACPMAVVAVGTDDALTFHDAANMHDAD